MPDEIASVELTADAAPFEAGVEKANQSVSGWQAAIDGAVGRINSRLESVTSRIASVSSRVSGMVGQVQEKVAGLSAMTNEEIGGSLGQGLGTLLGARLGMGELGGKIGKELGDGISKYVDFKAVVARIQEVVDTVKPLIDQVAGWWSAVFDDAKATLGEVADLVKGLGIGDLLAGDLDAAAVKIIDTFDAAVGKIEGFFQRFAARVVDSMDSVWNAVKEPLAKVADFVQRLLVRVGLLDAGTASWGDTIRSVQEIGRTVFGAVAYAVGYVGGVFKVVGGYIGDYLVAPLVGFMGKVLTVISDVFNRIGDNIAGVIGRKFKEAAALAKMGSKDLEEVAAKIAAASEVGKNTDLKQSGRDAREAFLGGVDQGKEDNAAREAYAKLLGIGQAFGTFWDRLAEMNKKAGVAADKAAETVGGSGTVAALQQGSREAQNAIAKARGEASLQEKMVAAQQKQAEELAIANGKLADQNRLLEKLLDKFDEIGTA